MEAAKVSVKVDVDGAATASHSLETVSDHVSELGHAALAAAAELAALGVANAAGSVTQEANALATSSAASSSAEATTAIGAQTVAETVLNGVTLALTATMALLAAAIGAGVTGAVIALVGALVALTAGLIAAGGAAMATVAILGLLAAKGLTAALGVEDLSAALEKLEHITPAVSQQWNILQGQMKDLGNIIIDVWKDVGPTILDALNGFVEAAKGDFAYALRVGAKLVEQFLAALHKAEPVIKPVLKVMGQMAHVAIELFRSFIPLAGPSIQALKDIFMGLADGLGAIVKAGAPFIETVGKALGDLLSDLGQDLADVVTAFGPTIKPFIEVIGTLVTPFTDLIKNVAPGFIKFLDAIAGALGKIPFGEVGKALGGMLEQLAPAIGPLTDAVVAVVDALTPFIPLIGELLADAIKLVAPLLPPLVPVFKEMADAMGELLPAVEPFIKLLTKQGGRILKDIADIAVILIEDGFIPMIPVLGDLFKALRPVIRLSGRLLHAFMPLIKQALPPLIALLGIFTDVVENVVVPVLQSLKDPINAVIGKLKDIGDAWQGFKDAFERGVQVIKDWFLGLKDKILGFFDGAVNWLVTVGQDMVQGLINGVQSMAGAIGTGIVDWLSEHTVGWFKDLIGANSPSKVMDEIGRDVVRGFHQGIQAEQRKAKGMVLAMPGVSMDSAASRVGHGGRDRPGYRQGVKVKGKLDFDWKRGVADLDGAMAWEARNAL